MLSKLKLILLLFIIGCSEQKIQQKQPKQYTQKCEMCGTEWTVTKKPAGKMKWCFHDGKFCEEGFNLYIKVLEKGENEKTNAEFFDHCKTCVGCRCATFNPEEWDLILKE